MLRTLCLAALLGACNGDPEDTGDTADTAAEDTDSLDALPASPLPLSVTTSGNESLALSFTRQDCQSLDGSGDLRERWYDDVEAWILTLQITDDYDGAGLYDETEGATILLMHSVAQGAYYTSADGDHTVAIDVDLDDGTVAAGDASTDGLTDAATGGTVTLSPATLPLWCTDVRH